MENPETYYRLTRPCKTCPFIRANLTPLRPGRVAEIERLTERGAFTCHATTIPDPDPDPEDAGNRVDGLKARHCAGLMIVREKLARPSQMMRIAERLGMYDPSKLDMKADVYDTFAEMRRAAQASQPKGG